jgi:hypothetical protein
MNLIDCVVWVIQKIAWNRISSPKRTTMVRHSVGIIINIGVLRIPGKESKELSLMTIERTYLLQKLGTQINIP